MDAENNQEKQGMEEIESEQVVGTKKDAGSKMPVNGRKYEPRKRVAVPKGDAERKRVAVPRGDAERKRVAVPRGDAERKRDFERRREAERKKVLKLKRAPKCCVRVLRLHLTTREQEICNEHRIRQCHVKIRRCTEKEIRRQIRGKSRRYNHGCEVRRFRIRVERLIVPMSDETTDSSSSSSGFESPTNDDGPNSFMAGENFNENAMD